MFSGLAMIVSIPNRNLFGTENFVSSFASEIIGTIAVICLAGWIVWRWMQYSEDDEPIEGEK